MTTLHLRARTADVHPAARLADDVVVGPGVVVERDVEVGAGTRLLAGTVLLDGTVIGKRCTVGPYAVIGGTPMDKSFAGEPSTALVADDVEIREFATVHRATGEGNRTTVGSGTLVMSYVHVSHNTQVGERVVLTTGVQLGGHSVVGDRAVIGSNTLLHQFCRVGTLAMFGAGSASNLDILPFSMARGNPARHYRVNGVGLRRNGVDNDRYRVIERALRFVRRRDLTALEELAAGDADAALLVEFLNSSERGVARFVTGG
jgi:UDP-N-acetylglucosamine acyltransferase